MGGAVMKPQVHGVLVDWDVIIDSPLAEVKDVLVTTVVIMPLEVVQFAIVAWETLKAEAEGVGV